jgi:hypothetical protein
MEFPGALVRQRYQDLIIPLRSLIPAKYALWDEYKLRQTFKPLVWGQRLNCWSVAFVSVLSSIPTTKNKIHHLCAEIRHDSVHPFREKPLCTREVG